MKMPDDVLQKEKEIFVDLWNFRKSFYKPSENEDSDFWESLKKEADSIGKKYDNDKYVEDIIHSMIREVERRECGSADIAEFAMVQLEDGTGKPKRATKHSAGYDLAAYEGAVIAPEEIVKVRTGVHVSPPNNAVGLLFIRSSFAKCGLRLSTGVSVIDSDYTGEILAYVHNVGNEIVKIDKGERFCQIVFVPYKAYPLVTVEKLPETERGGGGFGSTGK